MNENRKIVEKLVKEGKFRELVFLAGNLGRLSWDEAKEMRTLYDKMTDTALPLKDRHEAIEKANQIAQEAVRRLLEKESPEEWRKTLDKVRCQAELALMMGALNDAQYARQQELVESAETALAAGRMASLEKIAEDGAASFQHALRQKGLAP